MVAVQDLRQKENSLIPESSDYCKQVKKLHSSVILFGKNLSEVRGRIKAFAEKEPSEISCSEYKKFREQLMQAVQDAEQFLEMDTGYDVGTRDARAIVEVKAFFEHELAKTDCTILQYGEFDRKIETFWQHYMKTDWQTGDFNALKRELQASFGFSGLINECKKFGYERGVAEAHRLYKDIEFFQQNREECGQAEESLAQQCMDLESKIDAIDGLAEIRPFKAQFKEGRLKTTRSRRLYKALTQRITDKVDAKVAEVVDKAEANAAKLLRPIAYTTLSDLEQGLQRIIDEENLIDATIPEIERISLITGKSYAKKLKQLKAQLYGKKSQLNRAYCKVENERKGIEADVQMMNSHIESLDKIEVEYTKGAVNLPKYIDTVVGFNLSLQNQTNISSGADEKTSNLLIREIEQLHEAYLLFQEKLEKANVQVTHEMQQQKSEILGKIHETGIDFSTDRAMLTCRKLELDELKSCVKRYNVTRSFDLNTDNVEARLKQIGQHYDSVQANLKLVDSETNRIAMYVTTDAVDELKKMQLDENRFSLQGPYYDAAVASYKDAVASAKMAIQNEKKASKGVFDLKRHMRKFKPVNQDYLVLPEIILGTYKCAKITEIPEVLEEKLKTLPFAEHERDFEYLEAFNHGLKAWKKSGPIRHMFKNSGTLRHAVDKMIAFIEDYINKSKKSNEKS
jgi:hypothetical protein